MLVRCLFGSTLLAEARVAWPAASCIVGILSVAVVAQPAPAQAQHCALICAPMFSFTPALIRSHLFGNARVRSLSNGSATDIPSTNNAELVLGVGAPTVIPRLSMVASFQWLPTAADGTNPFTEYTATQLDAKVRANTPSLTLGASISAVEPTATRGWLGLSAYVADLYSAAARPRDGSAFTHKLDLGLSASPGVFNWAPKRTRVHNVTGTAILDYVATGVPRAGDEVPAGERGFVTGARPAVLILGRLIPVAPGDPKQ